MKLMVLSLLFAVIQAQAAPILAEPIDSQWWHERHELFLRQARTQKIEVLFLGDSITEGWKWNGARAWSRHFERLRPANFGIGGDRIEQLLWRVENGELDAVTAKKVVLLIGTNNLWSNTVDEIVEGHRRLVGEIRRRLPFAQLIVYAIFPRDDQGSEGFREKIGPINLRLAEAYGGRFVDIGEQFLSPSGSISLGLLQDGLHLTEKGYELWTRSLRTMLSPGRRGD